MHRLSLMLLLASSALAQGLPTPSTKWINGTDLVSYVVTYQPWHSTTVYTPLAQESRTEAEEAEQLYPQFPASVPATGARYLKLGGTAVHTTSCPARVNGGYIPFVVTWFPAGGHVCSPLPFSASGHHCGFWGSNPVGSQFASHQLTFTGFGTWYFAAWDAPTNPALSGAMVDYQWIRQDPVNGLLYAGDVFRIVLVANDS